MRGLPKKLRKFSKTLNCESLRLQPVLFQFGGKEILIINSYFPTDPKTINVDNSELVATLAILTNLIETTTFQSLYLAGDLNSDFLRNSSHVQAVREFLSRLNLIKLWDTHDVDFTHTFERQTGEVYHNTLDHIVRLLQMEIPDSVRVCNDVHCNEESHKRDIDNYETS